MRLASKEEQIQKLQALVLNFQTIKQKEQKEALECDDKSLKDL